MLCSSFFSFVTLAASLLFISTAAAGVDVLPEAESRVNARLVCETDSLKPGTTAMLGVHFKIEKDWHIYWDGLNDTGMAPTVTLHLPPGYEAGAIRWPAPQRHVAAGDILDHIYEGEVLLTIPITVPASPPRAPKPGTGEPTPAIAQAPDDQVTIKADLDWLVCKNVCIAESQEVRLRIAVAKPGGTVLKSKDAGLFETASARLPKPWPAASMGATWEDTTLVIKAPGAVLIGFFPKAAEPAPTNLLKEGEVKADVLRLRFTGLPDSPEGKKEPLTGIVHVQRAVTAGSAPRGEFFELSVALPPPKPVRSPEATDPSQK